MWYHTKATKILGIEYPVLQGPFGGNLSTAELAAAVSNSGGLGGYGAYTLSPEEIIAIDKQIRTRTNKPYNLNLWVSDYDALQVEDAHYEKAKQVFKPYFDELGIPVPEKPAAFKPKFENQVDALLDLRPPAFSFVFGIPSKTILDQCRKLGIVTIGAATTLDEAIALEAAEVDLIVASGFEAGGHRPSFLASSESSLTGTFVLVQQIREKVRTPLVAAGGIANGRGVAAAMALGASAAQVGTAFLACEESNAPDVHRKLLFSDQSRYTTLSRSFTGRLGRGLTSRVSKETIGMENKLLPFPLQSQFMSTLRKAALDQQKWDMVMFWSGQIAPVLKHRRAGELMQSIIEESNAYFAGLK
jgi:nitronate monooxygenase